MSRFLGNRVETSHIAAKNTVSECQLFTVPTGTYYGSGLTFGSGTQPSSVLETTKSNLLIRSVDRNVDFNANLKCDTSLIANQRSSTDEIRISVKPETFPSSSGLPLAVVNENTPLPKFPTVEILDAVTGHPISLPDGPLSARLLHSGDLALLYGITDQPLQIQQLSLWGEGSTVLIDVFGSYFSSAPIPY